LQQQLISVDNLAGTITNSDLELAGTILHEAVLANIHDLREKTVHINCDNTPAVAWRSKGSITSNGAAADLLRLASLHQRQHRHVPRVHYMPGPQNVLADIASRKFDLDDMALLNLLSSLAPQKRSWVLHHPPPDMLSMVISTLQRRRAGQPSLTTAPVPPMLSGPPVGSPFWPTSTSKTLSCPISVTKSPFLESLPNASATDVSAAVVTQSGLLTYVTKFYTSRRRSPNWGPRTLV
jgi:hypothetical protein